jgi:hypothetical protein
VAAGLRLGPGPVALDLAGMAPFEEDEAEHDDAGQDEDQDLEEHASPHGSGLKRLGTRWSVA